MIGFLRGKHRRADLPAMLAALDEALTVLDGRADGQPLDAARSLVDRAGERLRLSGEHTVVALAGSTGSGKSSIFNALAGSNLAFRLTIYSRPYNHLEYGYATGHNPSRTWYYPPDYDGDSTNVIAGTVDPTIRTQRRRQLGVGS